MFWLDWIIVFIPLLMVIWIGAKSQKYVRSVSDFMAAGRVAGRYVICVASGEAAMGLISVVAIMERDYQCGFAFSFWNHLTGPLSLIFALTGYCTYRFRETRAMTMGQFLEMRYNRAFRVFAAILQSTSGIINYAIFPAVSARFLVYFLDLPPQVELLGLQIPMTALMMIAFLGIALAIILVGGQVTIMVTDCMQGLLSYPMYVIIVAYILWRFSWSGEMEPIMSNRVAGESFLNPNDIGKLRDFNIVYVIIGMISTVLNRLTWSSSIGYSAAARNAHEQKIGGLLGTWRSGLSGMMYTLLAVAAITYMNHSDFRDKAFDARTQLATKVLRDVAGSHKFDDAREKLIKQFESMTPASRIVMADKDKFVPAKPVQAESSDRPLSQKDNQETIYYSKTAEVFGEIEGGKAIPQQFRTIYGQMLVPLALREMFPIGITGIFCALMIFLLISTDTTYMHSWGSVLMQDIILPLRGKAFSPKAHLNMLRLCITAVCIFSFFFSVFFEQMDYILMFFQITGAIWMGGAGPVILFGLYSKRGTSAGAFAALIAGSGIAVSGFVSQIIWPSKIYPWLLEKGYVEAVQAFCDTITKPFGTLVEWNITPTKFPINSMEIYFISMISAYSLYIIFSLLTCRKPFNLEKMLHRGEYALADGAGGYIKEKWTLRNAFSKFIGITNEYTLGDKILAWSVFSYSFIYSFVILFVLVVVWDWAIYEWPLKWWSNYFLLTKVIIVGIIGVVTTIWFTICCTKDLIRLFKDLDKRIATEVDINDDGRVNKDDDMSPEVEA